jgi:hypothetical protein
MAKKQKPEPSAEVPDAVKRIKAMRRRAEEVANQKEALRDRARQAENEFNRINQELRAALADLRGICVRVNGDAKSVDFSYAGKIPTTKTFLLGGGHPIIRFDVVLDRTTRQVSVMHDDTPISIDVALDLATAAVEAVFDDGSSDMPTDEDEWELPF